MEAMHLTARLVIEQNMHNTTAFSARPDAPVLPADTRRRPVKDLASTLRRRTTLRRAHARRPATAGVSC